MQRVAWSPDGLRVATSSEDRSLKIWDASSGACLHSLHLYYKGYKIFFSTDGLRLAVQSEKRNFIYDFHSDVPRLLKELPGYPSQGTDLRDAEAIAMSPQGDRIISGSGHTAEIRSTATGERLLVLRDHMNTILSVAFSPDGTEVVTCSRDRTAVVCDSWMGQQHRVYQMSSQARSVAYSPDGDLIAMGDDSGRVKICDAKSGTFIADLEGHTGRVWQLQFTDDARVLLSGSDDGTLRMWSIRDLIRAR